MQLNFYADERRANLFLKIRLFPLIIVHFKTGQENF
jgi:hypothetical protein